MAGALRAWALGWWAIVSLGARMLVRVLSASTYRREGRAALALHIVQASAPNLLWFTVLSALISLVLIRIVVVTAVSYGLSKFALEMVVRVLVLELIPLTAALFVALRCTLAHGVQLAALRSGGVFEVLREQGVDPLRREVLPRVVAGVFAVVMLAAVSGVVCLVLAYLLVYGFTPWAFAGYTRTVGQVFGPVVSLIFALKTLFFGLAVSLIPVAAALHDAPAQPRRGTPAEVQGLVRMFMAILLIEALSLVGNYH